MATTGIDTSSLALSGLASGFDWKSFVSQMVAAERAPEATMQSKQSVIQQRNSAFNNIKTQLTALQTQIDALKEPTLFDSRAAQSSNSSVATVSADGGAPIGNYTFNFTQLATASAITGSNNIASPLSTGTDVSGVILATAGFPAPVTAGTFTVNGQQIKVTTSESLQQVFSDIATATASLPANQQVTAAYDPASDTIRLTSSGPIVLGSATDTSNFLQVARLHNNGTGSISSSLPLGSISTGLTLANAHFATPLAYDTNTGAGQFQINGVTIAFNANTDTVSALLDRINSSQAGVGATYDAVNDRFVLTSKATGDIGISLQDVAGSNFLAAAGLTADKLTRGQDLQYTINGGSPLVSQSNTITRDSSGLVGLSVTALAQDTPVTVTVSSDTSKVKSAIKSFVDAYNQVQSYISTQTASSTDANGKVTAGLLASDGLADDIASSVRGAVFAPLNGLSGALSHLSDLGYQTNGYNDQLALSDSSTLDTALANNLPDIKQLFTDPTNGLVARMDTALNKIIGDNGSLATHQSSLTKQSNGISTQIANLEKVISADQKRMTNEFVAMETAQAQINQQLSYLTKNFG